MMNGAAGAGRNTASRTNWAVPARQPCLEAPRRAPSFVHMCQKNNWRTRATRILPLLPAGHLVGAYVNVHFFRRLLSPPLTLKYGAAPLRVRGPRLTCAPPTMLPSFVHAALARLHRHYAVLLPAASRPPVVLLLPSSAPFSFSPAPLPLCGAAAAARAGAASRNVLALITGCVPVNVVLHVIPPMQGFFRGVLAVIPVEGADAGRPMWKGFGLVDGDGDALHMLERWHRGEGDTPCERVSRRPRRQVK